jgi:hypothetical protein
MRVGIVKDVVNPVDKVVLEQAILDISEGVKELNRSKLNHQAVVVLLHHSTGVSQREIKTVLAGISDLKNRYLK